MSELSTFFVVLSSYYSKLPDLYIIKTKVISLMNCHTDLFQCFCSSVIPKHPLFPIINGIWFIACFAVPRAWVRSDHGILRMPFPPADTVSGPRYTNLGIILIVHNTWTVSFILPTFCRLPS